MLCFVYLQNELSVELLLDTEDETLKKYRNDVHFDLLPSEQVFLGKDTEKRAISTLFRGNPGAHSPRVHRGSHHRPRICLQRHLSIVV